MLRRVISAMPAAAMFALILIGSVGEACGASVWREGENPDRTNAQGHPWYDRVKRDKLSNGDWLSHFSDQPGRAMYRLNVPKTGRYTIWIRANPVKAQLQWQVNGGQWRVAPLSEAAHRRNIAADGKPDLRFIGWIRLDEIQLNKGEHVLRFRFTSDNKHHGALDALYLTTDGPAPVGKMNPKEAANQHASGFFAWSPGRDPLTGESPINLRHLNEPRAGMHGFVRRSGDRFVTGNDEPVRFWAVQGGLGKQPDQFDRRARRLAKYGVNLVRLGGLKLFRSWRNDRQAFRQRLDQLHAKIAALKAQGIYTYIDHLYWHTHTKITRRLYPGFGDGKHAIALLFFSDKFQKRYLAFLRDLLTTNNPHTGRPIAKEPAVAFVELQNESSLLFWTFKPREFPDPERKLVEKQFGDWLKKKYGSLRKARRAWGAKPRKGDPTADQFAAGRAGLYATGKLTGQDWAVRQRNPRRARDQLQFMVEAQKRFYRELANQLRQKLGARQLIVPSNWKTADARILDALERYTYTAGDVVARNTYFGVDYKKNGRQRFYAVERGDTYRDRSALKSPHMPTALGTPQVADYPFMITENNWTRPNRYRVEWPMLVGTYGAMAGIDGWTFFAKKATDWRHTMGVWDLSNPSVLGQFPAAALMYRRGDVQTADQPAVQETVSLERAYSMKGTRAVPLRGVDALWASRETDTARETNDNHRDANTVDPLAYFVGPVTQSFLPDREAVDQVNLDRYIDRQAKRVASLTGQLRWNAETGVVRVDSPRVQGAFGFLQSAGRIELSEVTIESDNRYGSVVVISLDGKPLRASKRVLVQAGTWDRPYGFATESAGSYRRITNLGGYPLNVRRIDATVRLTSDLANPRAMVLNGNGYRTDRRPGLAARDGRVELTLPADALYTVIEPAP